MKTMSIVATSRSLRSAGHVSRTLALMLGILAVIFLGTAAGRAGSGGVVDNGAFFSEQAKSDAVKVIAEMERTLKRGVLIETFKEIPADVKTGVNLQDKPATSQMYDQWARKQAKQHGVNGVYVLIVKSPSHLQTEVGTETQQLAFTMKDRTALASLMVGKLGAKQNDEALRDGVNFVSATMKSHLPNHPRTGTAPVPVPSHPAQSSGGMGWLIPAIVIGLVVWVVIGIIRAISGRVSGGSAMGQAGGGGGAGGGFFSSLIGGMFGAAAGMWMYDQFFSSHGNSAYGADHNDVNGGDSGFSGQDTDYSGSGDDFGGGSDGGSSGGGDFGGGGDSGGGGDF